MRPVELEVIVERVVRRVLREELAVALGHPIDSAKNGETDDDNELRQLAADHAARMRAARARPGTR